jgi:hypothetical protein
MVAGFTVRPKARKGGAALLSSGVMLAVLSLFVGTASASGEYATASLTSPTSGTATTFVWSYEFHQDGGHALSNIAIRFCDTSLLDHVVSASPNATVQPGGVTGGHTGFGPGIRFDVQDPSGTLTVTFDQAYGIAADSMEIESHSGDGQAGDLIKQAAGPAGATCTTDPTTTTTVVDNPTTTTVVDNPTTTTVVGDPTTTTVPGDPSSTTTVAGNNSATGVKVLGETITADGARDALAMTGSDTRAQLALAGLALTLGGIAVTFGERRKRAVAE